MHLLFIFDDSEGEQEQHDAAKQPKQNHNVERLSIWIDANKYDEEVAIETFLLSTSIECSNKKYHKRWPQAFTDVIAQGEESEGSSSHLWNTHILNK